MKCKKLLALILAALMTSSSVGVTAFAEGDLNNGGQQEESDIALFSANLLEDVSLSYVRVNSNQENTAKGFSCNFNIDDMPNLATDLEI